jgi:glycosyltransferase involved in cell wall biosynthesis
MEAGERLRALPSEYLLTVANDYPHKDWAGLLRGLAQVEDLPPLVLVGAPRNSGKPSPTIAAAKRSGAILWGAEQNEQVLERLYRNAQAYVAHSHLEAFPLTPFEALARGIRVVASDIPSHREVCGANAYYYDPDDPEALASAIRKALHSSAHATIPQQRTWDDNAAELATILHDTGDEARL